MLDDEFDITDRVYFPPRRESKFDLTLRYLGAFLAGIGFLATSVALGIWWGYLT